MYGLIQTHPNDPNRPLVDFDLALTFIPALLLGVSFGVRSWMSCHHIFLARTWAVTPGHAIANTCKLST